MTNKAKKAMKNWIKMGLLSLHLKNAMRSKTYYNNGRIVYLLKQKNSSFLMALFIVGAYVVVVIIFFLLALVNFDAAIKSFKLQGNLGLKGWIQSVFLASDFTLLTNQTVLLQVGLFLGDKKENTIKSLTIQKSLIKIQSNLIYIN